MSSHREAPEIAKDPAADSTDTYAFVSPDRPGTVTIIANFIPLQKPDGGPNFYEFARDVVYDIRICNTGSGFADIVYTFHFDTWCANPESFLYNTGQIKEITDTTWNRPQFYTLTRTENGTTRTLGTELAVPPVNVGTRSTPDYAHLADQAVHTIGGRKVFAGPAGRCVPRRPRQRVRPRRAAPVQPGAPDPAGEDGRHQLGAVVQRAHDRDPGADLRGHPQGQQADRRDEPRLGDRRVVDGPPSYLADPRQVQGQVRGTRRAASGLPARQPAVQRGDRADGQEGRVERPEPGVRLGLREVRAAAGAREAAARCSTRATRSRT
jgi:hypothetical protein